MRRKPSTSCSTRIDKCLGSASINTPPMGPTADTRTARPRTRMPSLRQRLRWGWTAVAAVGLVADPAHAADSDLSALLGVRLGHTDNIALAAEGLEQADDLAEVTAG